ncbi:MAG: hypothetical protein K2P99_02140, partial [Burkholderiales bacterium]|nr:hypothetical protein [Burkholderiales bacterium]
LNNFFHLSTNKELGNKPGLIISISSGLNGVYPVTELRINSYKNNYICYIPQHVIVRNVNTVLNKLDVSENDEDKFIRSRIESSLQVLAEYAKGFQIIRASDAVQKFPFSYGM